MIERGAPWTRAEQVGIRINAANAMNRHYRGGQGRRQAFTLQQTPGVAGFRDAAPSVRGGRKPVLVED